MRHLLILIGLVSMSRQNVISTAQGKLRGVSNVGFTSYNGIPYASVRETNGKFKQAGLAPSWFGIRESQRTLCTTKSVEECLQLDVHVPTTGGAPWPVLVWVAGSGSSYHPGRLVQQGIIVVIVHHRFGPYGFLCTKEEQIPGNAGAKDVVLALRWVRDNIVAFRGNPAKVVVGGQGFGAAIVEGLMLSPMAEGLLHGAIMQSGTILSPWAFNYDAAERALTLGKMYTDTDYVASSLLKASNEDIAEKADQLYLSYFPFGMCVDKPSKKDERFLSEPPFDLLSNVKVRKVPLIIGFNSDEGYIFAGTLNRFDTRKLARNINILVPEEIKAFSDREAKMIQEIYFTGKLNMTDVLTFHRDVYIVNHVHRSVRFHASVSDRPVYYYQFSHSGSWGVEEESGLVKAGAAHSDELALLFPDKRQELEGEDGDVQRKIVGLWTNFVKHLNPNAPGEQSRWAPTDAHQPRLLDISTDLTMKSFPYERECRFWDDIYERHYYDKLRNTV